MSNYNTKRSLLYGVITSYFSFGVSIFFNLLLTSLAIRYLPEEQVGILLLFIALFGIVNLLDFGLSSVLTREIAFITDDTSKAKRLLFIFSAAKKLNLKLSVIVLFFMSLGLSLYCYRNLSASLYLEVFLCILLFFFLSMFKLSSNIPIAFINGTNRVAIAKSISSITDMFGIIFLCSSFLCTKTLLNFVITFFIKNICFLFLSHKYLNLNQKTTLKLIFHQKYLLKKAWPLFLTSLGAFLIFQVTPIIITHYLGEHVLIHYSPLLQILMGFLSVTMLLMGALSPFISNIYSRMHAKAAGEIVFLLLKINMAVMFFFVLILNLFGDLFFHIWLGKNYQLDSSIFFILSITILLEVQLITLATGAMSCGYSQFACIAWFGGLLNVFFLIFFIPKYGLIGAAIATFLAQLLTNNWFVVYVSLKFFHISFKQFIFEYLLRILIIILFLFGVCNVIFKVVNTESLQLLSVGFIIPFLIIISTYFFLLSPAERSKVNSIRDIKSYGRRTFIINSNSNV